MVVLVKAYGKMSGGDLGGLGEWLNPPDCKSGARKGYVGSNPTPSPIYGIIVKEKKEDNRARIAQW